LRKGRREKLRLSLPEVTSKAVGVAGNEGRGAAGAVIAIILGTNKGEIARRVSGRAGMAD
jgi:hypothetical protein